MKATAFFALLLMSALFSSCYYSSPVPISGEKLPIDKRLVGDWTSSDNNSTMNLHIDPPKRGVSSGMVSFIEYSEDGAKKEEKHTLELFDVIVGDRRILNVGLDLKADTAGGYMFGEYAFVNDSLTFSFVKEDAFRNTEGEVWKTQISGMLHLKIADMLKSVHDTVLFERNEPIRLARQQ
jgi:hypothetical protein